ncbi:hypothetical protein HOA55_04915 [archaeon]|jgi:hypothetical protein|nr:hypothetical protein [archaeon]MBT3578121.1 hypothetical protein [archaeon]MBT6820669.1 hypothetical protein [archaeon]MBT6955686.1 hypothetical protein [archaeon]MBT7024921.1 hypothetical protein [archaeon]
MGKEGPLTKRAKKLLESYGSKFTPDQYKDGLHYENMLKFGEEMKKSGHDFNIDAYNAAVWIHDLGHYVVDNKENLGGDNYNRDEHKRRGLDIFNKEFREHINDEDLEEKISACIVYHSGPLDEQGEAYLLKHPELQVIREADRASFYHPSFTLNHLQWNPDKEKLSSFEKFINDNYDEFMNLGKPTAAGKKIINKWRTEADKLISSYRAKNSD